MDMSIDIEGKAHNQKKGDGKIQDLYSFVFSSLHLFLHYFALLSIHSETVSASFLSFEDSAGYGSSLHAYSKRG